MVKFDPEREAHKAWLGLVQPVGLVVSPPALIKAQVVLDQNVIEIQQALLRVVVRPASLGDDAEPALLDFPRFATEVLGWSPGDLAGAPGGAVLSDTLAVTLPDYGETLRPTYAALDGMGAGQVMLLVQVTEDGTSLDKPPIEDARTGWPASPQARLERLLRDTGVAAGLLLNGAELRLVYAPRGESSGHIGFPIAEMCTVGGRSLLAALHMLLSEHRVFGAPDKQRLLDLLVESRKYQNEVSNRLAEQVLGALWELLRGFQAADEAAHGQVLRDLARTDPQQIYGGLLTVIMRLVFLLYAEDQGLMPDDPVYARNYAIGGLFERLREDAGRYPDTMDQRFGAYAWLLSTFRMVFDGGAHGGLHLPTRHGQLFNPDEYPFLEGRPPGIGRVMGETFEAPRVSDGIIWRVLEGLLVLDGERLSYRALDVEQVGSVYESMMGFDVRTLPGRAIAVRPKLVVFDLDALLAIAGSKRAAWLKEQAECDLGSKGAQSLRDAITVEDLVAALGRKTAPQTPRALAPGQLFLQPGEERRRSGSHYTPRELTEPIVRTTLLPVLHALGPRPTPEQVLELKVCDPAMGSGAFLVESCRQLAEALVAAWEVHKATPKIPPDEDPLLHARRLVAQSCLYGVDKNRFAVNLAKLSLWLVTLARDHAFTFLDHALKHGDSLVGLTKAQLGAFHWNPPDTDSGPLFKGIAADVIEVTGWRRQIQELGEGDYDRRRLAWKEAEDVVHDVRLIGDLCVAAYFQGTSDKDREALRRTYRAQIDRWKAGGTRFEMDGIVAELRGGERPVLPLHWEIEFPEVFGRANPGFDAFVGNPPFLGGTLIGGQLGLALHDYLVESYPPATGLADIAAFFLRRCFSCCRRNGTLGLIATNTVAQGDTRSTGLQAIVQTGGVIYSARRRYQWPGMAAVIVSVVHVARTTSDLGASLDGVTVGRVSSFLLAGSTDAAPAILSANKGRCYLGTKIWGAGFVFEDNPSKGSSSLEDRLRLITKNPRNAEVIVPYMGGEEFNESPTLTARRFVIEFDERTKSEAMAWPDIFAIVEERVRPVRATNKQRNYRDEWWRHANRAAEAAPYASAHGRLLAVTSVTKHLSFGFVSGGTILANTLVLVLHHTDAAFAILQSRAHEIWARFLGSSLEDRLRYTTACFDTFPFPPNWQAAGDLEVAGRTYVEFRAALMARNNEGLTNTYNRFHDPSAHDPEVRRLRELHAEMDRAVLDAYGWADLALGCDFFLEYQLDEETWGAKKKPYRYRWPDAVHDEVLARLLVLNQNQQRQEVTPVQRGGREQAATAPAKAGTAEALRTGAKTPRKPKARRPNPTLSLFDRKEEDKS
jgi:hypothetical protein